MEGSLESLRRTPRGWGSFATTNPAPGKLRLACRTRKQTIRCAFRKKEKKRRQGAGVHAHISATSMQASLTRVIIRQGNSRKRMIKIAWNGGQSLSLRRQGREIVVTSRRRRRTKRLSWKVKHLQKRVHPTHIMRTTDQVRGSWKMCHNTVSEERNFPVGNRWRGN